MNIKLYNNPTTRQRRRDLRKNQTKAEYKLWRVLRSKQVAGMKFFRQYSIGPYIIDFYCPKQRLAIEIDGGHHDEKIKKQQDKQRTNYLGKQDIHVLRFWNDEILKNIEAVHQKINEVIHNPS